MLSCRNNRNKEINTLMRATNFFCLFVDVARRDICTKAFAGLMQHSVCFG